ncbi:MAG: MATE family efflux transporter [Prevotellaceae bacterium]|nr:MATE family efflux transporter [Prevotellaceae bacterium]
MSAQQQLTALLHTEGLSEGQSRWDLLRLIISFSIPSILAQISQVLMFFIDASMVGHLGAQASASIGLIEPAGWLFGSLTGATAMGFSVQVAHAIGARDKERARDIIRKGYRYCLLFSILLAAVAALIAQPLPHWLGGNAAICGDASAYFLIFALSAPVFMLENLSSNILKATGDMKRPSVIAISLCVFDVIFNYIFIYIFHQGVCGAAYGSVVAFIVTVIPLLYFVRRSFQKGFIQDNKEYTEEEESVNEGKDNSLPSPFGEGQGGEAVVSVARTALRISSPIALQYVLMNGAQLISTSIVAPLGTVAIAAHSLSITAESLCYMPGYGISDAATTLVGQSYGAGRKDLLRKFAASTIALAMSVMAFMGLLMWIFAPEMIAVLSPDIHVQALGAAVLRIEAWAEPFFGAAIVCNAVFVAMGDTLWPAVMNLGSMWCVRLTLAFWLSKTYGLRGVWIAMATELTFRGMIFLLRVWRKLRRTDKK